jgi:hypothetical protein
VSAAERRISVAWPVVDYAGAERVWERDLTTSGPWVRRTEALTTTSWQTPALGGHTYAVRLQPVKGRMPGATWSRVVTVRVPARPAAVQGFAVRPLKRCRARVSWRPARFATGYGVRLRDVTAAGAWRTLQAATVPATAVSTRRLHRRHRYAVVVRSYGPLLGGTSRVVRFRAC